MSLRSKASWTLLQAPAFFLFLGLVWEMSVYLLDIKAYLLPPPSAVAKALWQSRALLWTEGLVTLEEVLLGFLFAVLAGIVISGLIYSIPAAKRTIYPLVIALQGIPKVALAPLLIVWVGYGLASKVVMVFLFALFPIVISTLGGLNSTPDNLTEHFRALRASRWFTFRHLRLPVALPYFLDGCKVSMPLAVIGAVVGEFVGSSNGLGNLILYATSAGKTDLTFATLIVITVLSLILFAVIESFERRVWWRSK